MDRNLHYRHNVNIFAVEPKSFIIPLVQDIQDAPLTHNSYKVYNIGRTDVAVALLYGTNEDWHKVVEETTIKPGHTIIIDNVGKFFFASGLRISNNSEERAVVHCAKGNGSYPMVALQEQVFGDEEYCENLKRTYNVGVKYIPYTSQKYQALLDAFWPENRLNVWQEILKTLQPLLNSEILKDLSTTISQFMPVIKQQLQIFANDYDNNSCAHASYMRIGQDVSKFEENLTPKIHDYKEKSSLLLLPLLSNFIFLKVTFYALGFITGIDLSMSYTDQIRMKDLLKDTYSKAKQYINNLFEYHLDHAYNTSHPESLYNSMMSIRSYISIHGIEYLRVWHNVVLNPFGGVVISEGVISYSNFFGRPTPNLFREATSRHMYPPLTPRYLGLIYANLETIEVYLWRSRFLPQSPKIGGMKLTFADWSSYVMGTETGESEKIKLEGAHITKLEVTGTGAIDSCRFHISDERKLSFGTMEIDSEKGIFELKDHRIVSIFVSSDHFALEGQASNIAVAYNLNNKL